MNAAFEGCRMLGEMLEAARDDPAAGDVIADLTLDNFIEMRDRVASPLFLARKKLEKALSDQFPKASVPLYDLVSFSNVPYQEARERARRQDHMPVGDAAAASAAVVAGLVTGLALLLRGGRSVTTNTRLTGGP